jgi:hypothetical protein
MRDNQMWRTKYNENFMKNKIFTYSPALNATDYNGLHGCTCKKTLNRIPKEDLKAYLTSNQAVGKPQFKWEEDVKYAAARLPKCHKRKLAAENGTVWKLKL